MIVHNKPYINSEGYLVFRSEKKLGVVKRIRKQIDKYEINPEDLNFSNN